MSMSLVPRSLWLCLAVLLASTQFSFAAGNAVDKKAVLYCAPQHDVYPFFLYKNGKLAGVNPDMLRQIFANESLADATLKYTFRPWKRCNVDLENSSVDMMIGGYNPLRESVVYPNRLGFKLANAVISTAELCFYSITGRQMERTKRGMEGKASFVIGIEAGFSKRHESTIAPQWVELFNPVEKFRMLDKGRVDAIVQVCSMDGEFPIESRSASVGYTNFESMQPPYLSNPAYVVFSEKFARTHNALAKRIVIASQNLNKAKIYAAYSPKGF